MKKLLALILLMIASLACEETVVNPTPSDQISPDVGWVLGLSSTNCQPVTGNGTHNKTGDYNCHEFIRGALIEDKVNLYNGKPQDVDFSDLSHTTIQEDPNFIRLCAADDAEAIAHLPSNRDHSALILGNGSFAYSYPSGDYVYTSISALNYGTACDYEYFASIEDIELIGPVISGNNYTFTLQNLNNHSYILHNPNRWTYDTTDFDCQGMSNNQLTISLKPGRAGNYTVSAILNTSATKNPSGNCVTGVENKVTATTYTPTRSKSFTVGPDCGGTFNGGILQTVNYISSNTSYQAIMNESGWSWTKTSGNASWNTTGSGKYLNFSVPYGSATFRASKAGCYTRNITFSAY